MFSVYVNSSQLTTRVEYFAIIRSRLIAECFVFIFYFNATAADMKKFRVSAYRRINTVSLITCRNEPEARNIRVMKRTCIIVETAWFLSFVVFFSSATRLTMYFTGSRPKRYMYLNSELAQDSLGFSWQRKILFFIRR